MTTPTESNGRPLRREFPCEGGGVYVIRFIHFDESTNKEKWALDWRPNESSGLKREGHVLLPVGSTIEMARKRLLGDEE